LFTKSNFYAILDNEIVVFYSTTAEKIDGGVIADWTWTTSRCFLNDASHMIFD